MSLDTGAYTRLAEAARDIDDMEARLEAARLERYLAVLEDNRRASRFIPNDAALALDMAGFVRSRLRNEKSAPVNSITRLSLALVQTLPETPAQ